MSIFVTGAAGYIGSHTCVELLNRGYDIIGADNLCNSKIEAVDAIKEAAGRDFTFYQADIRDYDALCDIFDQNNIEAVVHFAALKAVGESVAKPLCYYENNLNSTMTLCRAMERSSIKRLVFSSSATVYGSPEKVPITEDFPTSATNPYGATKLMNERILSDLYNADNEWSIILLRYFNPIGAHESGLIGEEPSGIPNNLMPYIVRVAAGRLEKLNVFGGDYPTRDGTGVRDYIHVADLAYGHVLAVDKSMKESGLFTYNLGTGRGQSVLEIIENFEKATGVKIPYTMASRRPGDIAECYADTTKAKEELGFVAKRGILEMCRDSWNYILKQEGKV